MTKVAVAVPTVWISTLWSEAWTAVLLLISLSLLAFVVAWKLRADENGQKG